MTEIGFSGVNVLEGHLLRSNNGQLYKVVSVKGNTLTIVPARWIDRALARINYLTSVAKWKAIEWYYGALDSL